MRVNLKSYKQIEKGKKHRVYIDDYDVWSLDYSLSFIIYPALLKLKNKKFGTPFVDDGDVPEELHSKYDKKMYKEWEIDDTRHFLRWDYILDEIIWAFKQHSECDPREPFDKENDYKLNKEYNERKTNAFRLFGKYYQCLWC